MGTRSMLKMGDGVRHPDDPQGVPQAGRRRDGRGGPARDRGLRASLRAAGVAAVAAEENHHLQPGRHHPGPRLGDHHRLRLHQHPPQRDERPLPARRERQARARQAESVDISEDQLTYTFTLRDGIKWSNGDPVTAQDFKYAWKRVLNPDTGAQYAYIISTFVKGAEDYNEGNGAPETWL